MVSLNRIEVVNFTEFSSYFSGFDPNSIDRAVIQMSNAADKTTLPLMTVLNYFEGVEDDEALS